MEIIEKSIEVDRPLSAVYNQWTQFEDFPFFMDGVKSVQQLDDKRLHWEAEIAGVHKTWDAEIFEQVPDERIAWRSQSGVIHTGVVTFEEVSPERTRVLLHINFEPEGILENVAGLLGLVSLRVSGDLARFKDFIEARGDPPTAWRGSIHGSQVEPPSVVG